VQLVAHHLGSPLAVNEWLRAHWRVVDDPAEFEYVVTPSLQLAKAARAAGVLTGDCDDAAVLAASLLAALDWPSRLVAIRRRGEPDFTHVFVRTPIFEYAGALASELQIDIDPIVPAPLLPIAGDFEFMTVDV